MIMLIQIIHDYDNQGLREGLVSRSVPIDKRKMHEKVKIGQKSKSGQKIYASKKTNVFF